MIHQQLSGLGVFKAYIAMKQHFNPKNKYNIFDGVRIKYNQDQFDERIDKHFFYKISEKYPKGDVITYFMANMIKGNNHPAAMTEVCYREHQSRMQNLSYNFEKDLKYLVNLGYGFKPLFRTKSTALPIVLQCLNGGKIDMNTIAVINKITKSSIIKTFDKEIDNFTYEEIRYKILSYQDFIRADFTKLTTILSKYIGQKCQSKISKN